MARPNLSEAPSYYHNYMNLVREDDLFQALQPHLRIIDFLKGIQEEKWDHRYAEGKWTIKELIQHVIDAERIFSYRALCFARKDKTALPSFDENLYAENSKANNREKKGLLEELGIVQKASVLLFTSFDEEQLSSKGIANNNEVSVHAIGYILIGHTRHHINILKDRYL